MGAWIEILMDILFLTNPASLPLWERGLKLTNGERPLAGYVVAPSMGAWIEMMKH